VASLSRSSFPSEEGEKGEKNLFLIQTITHFLDKGGSPQGENAFPSKDLRARFLGREKKGGRRTIGRAFNLADDKQGGRGRDQGAHSWLLVS